MSKAVRATLGFDVDAAIRTLHREALAAGAVPKGDGRASDPHLTAEAHLHGLEATSCRKVPCRLGGLCHALAELVQYHAEVPHVMVVLDAAKQTEHARKWLRTVGYPYVQTLDALVKRGEERHRHEQVTTGWTHDHETLCVRPARVLQGLAEFFRSLDGFEDDLRGLAWSPELQQPGSKRRGDLLLRAVCQHLRWGGLSYSEIARLVPDGHGTKAGAAERVRKRIKEPNARSLLPREMDGDPAQRRGAGKRRTR